MYYVCIIVKIQITRITPLRRWPPQRRVLARCVRDMADVRRLGCAVGAAGILPRATLLLAPVRPVTVGLHAAEREMVQ